MNVGIGEWIVIGISVMIGAWFVIGGLDNNRRADRIFAWLHKGLADFGKLGGARRLDPSTVSMTLTSEESERRLPRLEATLNLERHENLLLWLFQSLVYHKRDLLILKTNLENSPHGELHALVKGDKATFKALNSDENHPLTLRSEQAGLNLYTFASGDKTAQAALEALITHYPGCFTRISLSPKSPHLTAHVLLGKVVKHDPQEFFRMLSGL